MPDSLRDYLERCLAQVPESRYRARLRSELEAHLGDLAESFLAGVYAAPEAEKLAMEKLGSPEWLQEEYREAWLRQPERWRRDLGRLFAGCGLALAGHFAALVFLEKLGSVSDAAAARRFVKTCGDPRWRLLSEAVLFAGETLPAFAWLALRFRRDPARRTWVTAGLLLAWALGSGWRLLSLSRSPAADLPQLCGTLAAAVLLGLVFS